MSFAFGWKNLFRKWKQSLSYIITIAILVGISVFFIYLGNGLGLVLFSSTPQYNITTQELFSLYFRFIIYASMTIALVWTLVINHSLIQHKMHDMAIMKAVGSVQKKLRSHFFSVVLLVDIIGIIFGVIAGFILYVIFFFILSAVGFEIVIYIDFIFVPILVVGILVFIFVVNGYELWRISTKNYANIALGDIPRNIDTQLTNRFPKNRLTLRIKLALRNLTRKRKSFYRVLLTTGITFSIIVTLTTSSIIVSSTSILSIKGAQGGDTLVFGHEDIVNQYIERYDEFSNSTLEFSNIGNLTQSQYLMNETEVDTIMNSLGNPDASYWDKRLFVYEFAQELKGYIYVEEDGVINTTEVGRNRTANIPVMGIEFGNYTSQWQIIGNIDSSPNSAIVGDTLAYEMFDAATYQKIRIQNITTSVYNITGVFYDSFCAGFATYVHLNALQQDFNITGKVNLVTISISSSTNRTALIQDIQEEITLYFGPDYIVRDLTPTFEKNIRSMYPFIVISGIIIMIETIVIIASLFFYQTGNFQERAPDFAIIKVMGGTSKLIKNIIFYEDLAILGIAALISIGVSLIFNGRMLYQDAILPPLWIILLLWLVISLLIVLLVRISIIFLYKELKRKQQEILKDFSRAK